MGIKLKNKYIYIASFIIGFYMLSLALVSAQDYMKNSGYLTNEFYFSNEDFKNKLTEYSGKVFTFYNTLKDYSLKSDADKVDKDKLEELKRRYNSQLKDKEDAVYNEYSQLIVDAERNGNKDKVNSLMEEKNKKLDEVKKENTKTEEELKKEVVKNSDVEYKNLKTYIQEKPDIKYYINNIKTGETYTNLDRSISIDFHIEKALHVEEFPYQDKSNGKFEDINRRFRENNCQGYLIIPKEVQGYSELIENYKQDVSKRTEVIKESITAGVSVLIGLFVLVFVKKHEQFKIALIDRIKGSYVKIPLDLRIVMFIIYSFMMWLYKFNSDFFYKQSVIDQAIRLTFITLYIVYLVYNIKGCIAFIKDRKKLLIQWEDSLFYRKFLLIHSTRKKIFIIGIFTLFTGVVTLSKYMFGPHGTKLERLLIFCVIYQFTALITALFYILKKSDYIDKILKGTEEILSGNLDYVIEQEGKDSIAKLAYNINNMRTGYKKSLESEIKSERLKTELITNVSHDLKTPLTSIINYINLLKKDGLSTEEIKSYIEVLDRKSERLKTLIEDLFEASKMSSGSVELNIEKVDVTELLKQSMAEFDEKFKSSCLTLKFNCDKKHIYANLDGKKSWRVFENLISNIIKYSQPNTRVYIDLVEEENKIKIVMKNISSYELDFNVDEIFERFKRGDKSRNKEGSGLGLTIAKSIVELQGGKLNVEIDGDLFKAIVQFNGL
ncbi:sensor histidine kinase [Clostridium sp. DJ247]|uniref:HAMP domain-containing sensor histidine kinase n=1 Tax=Clostridium sp. DJ247 TaxID=2726188 RepID=UPI001623ADE7|nr:sensor histidine kinase [Clostridium sp. DJ247]MBC2578853.1 sensor histidine kinase [Clostridium sp. DJ247]